MPEKEANYDESRVPSYTLPSPLHVDGQEITSASQWENQGRAATLNLFERHVYGKTLGDDVAAFTITSQASALDGLAVRKEIKISLGTNEKKVIRLLLYLPAAATSAVPVFLGLNFRGNQTIHSDPNITLSPLWTAGKDDEGFRDGFATEETRGLRQSRWPVESILKRGYGVATAYYGDLQLDRKEIDQTDESFHHWFEHEYGIRRTSESWGAIGIWAWQLSRCLDYLISDEAVDSGRVAVIGHSRLGKTALWAAAQDPRFALAISNSSGEGGAAIMRRRFGETIARITTAFPHWFNQQFVQYGNNEDNLPVDAHQIIALIAPRPVYVASATEDLWADPRGEFLGITKSSPVYALYDQETLDKSTFPAPNQPVIRGKMGYHIREGKHDITPFDWECYLNFAEEQWKQT